MEEASPRTRRRPEHVSHISPSGTQLPQSPRGPMEFLSRSWNVSALEVSKALAPPPRHHRSVSSSTAPMSASSSSCTTISKPEDVNGGETEELHKAAVGNQFSFTSSAPSTTTSQLVLERIMSQSEVSPLTSGRLSHSSGPLTNDNSPPVSPSEEFDDVVKYFRTHNSIQPLFSGGRRASAGKGVNTPSGAKIVGRWLKDRKERKKEETRAHNAQLHAAISVAAVASAVAAIAAATAASSSTSTSGKNEHYSKETDMAVATAATLVAAQCVEAAEAMGAEHDHLASIVSSAVNVRSHDDIMTITAAAATALRGAATLKARALKEVWNIAAVLPSETGLSCAKGNKGHSNRNYSGEFASGEDFLTACSQELLAKGSELLKRTRKGDLHWKDVSVYMNKSGQAILKMKSKHVSGTFTKKKNYVVLEVCEDMAAWPGRHLFDSGEQRRYFGLKTETRGLVEFECRSQKEYDLWTQGVSRLLSIVAESKAQETKPTYLASRR